MNLIKDKNEMIVKANTGAGCPDEVMSLLKGNRRMLMADQAGVSEGCNPPESTSEGTSQKYVEEAQSALITHLMSELRKYKTQELEDIDLEQKVSSNLTLDLFNK